MRPRLLGLAVVVGPLHARRQISPSSRVALAHSPRGDYTLGVQNIGQRPINIAYEERRYDAEGRQTGAADYWLHNQAFEPPDRTLLKPGQSEWVVDVPSPSQAFLKVYGVGHSADLEKLPKLASSARTVADRVINTTHDIAVDLVSWQDSPETACEALRDELRHLRLTKKVANVVEAAAVKCAQWKELRRMTRPQISQYFDPDDTPNTPAGAGDRLSYHFGRSAAVFKPWLERQPMRRFPSSPVRLLICFGSDGTPVLAKGKRSHRAMRCPQPDNAADAKPRARHPDKWHSYAHS